MTLLIRWIAFCTACLFSHELWAEARHTTLVGFANREVRYTPRFIEEVDDPFGDQQNLGPQSEQQDTMAICHRVSSPSSLGLEIGGGGCIMPDFGSATFSFANSVSLNLQLIYYPLASRMELNDDIGVLFKRQFFGEIYMFGISSLAKLGYKESTETGDVTPMDLIEFGGGIGWMYQLSRGISIGAEGSMQVGNALSTVATGGSNLIMGMAMITAHL